MEPEPATISQAGAGVKAYGWSEVGISRREEMRRGRWGRRKDNAEATLYRRRLIAPAQLKEAAHLDKLCFRLRIRNRGGAPVVCQELREVHVLGISRIRRSRSCNLYSTMKYTGGQTSDGVNAKNGRGGPCSQFFGAELDETDFASDCKKKTRERKNK